MVNQIKFFILALLSALVFSACEKDDPVIPNGEELITTLNYRLSPSDGGASITLSFVDLDGDGGNAPVITGGTLAPNQSYQGSLELLNEAESPAENITAEIEEEDEDHQFFFQSNVPNLDISYNDQDADNHPVGLSSTLATGAAASGSVTIILRHKPNKSASGVSEGDITNAGGETDIEVTFPIVIE